MLRYPYEGAIGLGKNGTANEVKIEKLIAAEVEKEQKGKSVNQRQIRRGQHLFHLCVAKTIFYLFPFGFRVCGLGYSLKLLVSCITNLLVIRGYFS